jgi:hypothetical protein
MPGNTTVSSSGTNSKLLKISSLSNSLYQVSKLYLVKRPKE